MSKQSSNTLKNYFLSGTVPTQEHFASLIDSSLNLPDVGINSAAAGQIALQSQYTPITGTVTTANGSATVTGKATKFLTEVALNTPVIIEGTRYTVTAVASDTSLTVNPPFAAAPAPIASNIPALVDPGVSLLLADASGEMRLQLLDGILHVPAGVTTNTLTATGQVTAASFSGSGANLSAIPMSALTGAFSPAQLPSIPSDKITGMLNTTQIPPIPASQITGQLAAAQIPSSFSLLFYASAPCISNGSPAQINWQADPSYNLQLDYLDRGMATSFSLQQGSGQFKAKIVQSTLFTLTASLNGQFIAQRQFWVDVVPIPIQKAMQLQFEGYSTEFAIGLLARRYKLSTLTPANVTALAQALNTAAFPQGEISQYIPAFYNALGTPFLQNPACVKALIQALGG